MTERTRPIGAGHTQPPASRIGETNLRASNPACETGGGGEPSSARTGTLMKRTRQCSGSSDKTNPSAEKRAAERAELSSRCNCAEAGMTKRTRAIPASQWKTVRADERSAAARTHSCKMNPSWCARSPSHRGLTYAQWPQASPAAIAIARREAIASSASFIDEIVPAFLC